jgi:Isochorismatase family
VESTACSAREDGFRVSLPVDVVTDQALSSHDHSIDRVFPWVAEVGTAEELVPLL